VNVLRTVQFSLMVFCALAAGTYTPFMTHIKMALSSLCPEF
jgi:hypothetical protein